VGDVVFAFDLLFLHGQDFRTQPYRNRRLSLAHIISGDFAFLKQAATAFNTTEKAALLEQMKHDNREGVVFKQLSASYTAGRLAGNGIRSVFASTSWR
jgi:bifunctional non-homologous end joining protein LigD